MKINKKQIKINKRKFNRILRASSKEGARVIREEIDREILEELKFGRQ